VSNHTPADLKVGTRLQLADMTGTITEVRGDTATIRWVGLTGATFSRRLDLERLAGMLDDPVSGLSLVAFPEGGSLKERPLMASTEGEQHRAEQLERVEKLASGILELSAMLFVTLAPPMSEGELIGQNLSMLVRACLQLTSALEPMFPPGELGGVMVAHLGDLEADQ
jgi:hypothetical protein